MNFFASDDDIEKQVGSKSDEIREVVQSDEKLRGLLGKVADYLRVNSARVGTNLMEPLGTLSRFVGSYLNGKYKDVSISTLSLIAFGFMYFISPIDLIPDALIPFGFADDAFVIGWVVKRISGELSKFRAWERIEDGRTELDSMNRDEIRNLVMIGGWFSKTSDYCEHLEIAKRLYPQAVVEILSWESNGLWSESLRQAEEVVPDVLLHRLETLKPQTTALIGHSLGGRIIVRTLRRLHDPLHHVALMGAAINSDDPDIAETVTKVRHDVYNFHSRADGVLRYLYRGFQQGEPLGLSGSHKEIPGFRNIKIAGTEEHVYSLIENAAEIQALFRGQISAAKLQWTPHMLQSFGNMNKHLFLEYMQFFEKATG